MRRLERAQFHRKAGVAVPLARVVQGLVSERGEDDLERLLVDLPHLGMGDAEMAELEERDAAPHAELEPAPPEMVQHADFLRQPDRVVEREDVDQGAKQHRPRPLGDGGEENAGGGRHAERRRVMLRHVVAVDSRRLVPLDHPQPVLVEVRQRDLAAAVDMVEDAELHPRGSGPAIRGATSWASASPSRGTWREWVRGSPSRFR